MEVKLNIKDKSVSEFLEKNAVKEMQQDGRYGHENHPYYMLKDELYFKIDCELSEGEILRIEAFDKGMMSRKELINEYTYQATSYDDHSLKLVLIDFKVYENKL